MKRTCTLTTAFALSLLALAVIPTVRAEEQPVVYTRVAQWQIARPNWGAYEKDLKKNTVPVMEKLLADGTITEFGADRTTVHTPDGYTHSTWFCSKSLAGLEKALDAIVESEGKLLPEERKKQDTDFAGTKHADLILRSVAYQNRTVKTEKGYETVAVHKMQPGKAQDYMALYDKYTKPVLEQLYKDGALTAFGVDAELVHNGDPAYRFFWQMLPDADALDKVQAAFDAAREKRTPEERRAIGQAFAELSDMAAHRDSRSNVLFYSVK
jgi:competence protein ComGC